MNKSPEHIEHIDTMPAEQGALGMLNDMEKDLRDIEINITELLSDEKNIQSKDLIENYKKQIASIVEKLPYVLIPDDEPEHTIVQGKFLDIHNRTQDAEGMLSNFGRGFLSGPEFHEK